ncbi:MAG: hypothetical protein K6G83_05625 [Lachnospiraceae bacterium]|nr:hypothetical protein [Lachnospiraceae bacterium]
MLDLDFRDKPVENEIDRMFDYDVDGVLNPVEQLDRLVFLTGYVEKESDDDGYEPGNLTYLDPDDLDDMDEDERRDALEDAGYDPDDYYGCSGSCMSEEESRKWDETLDTIRKSHEKREHNKALIIIGILSVACIVFASSPGIILFIGAMLLSAKISKIF